MKKSIFFLLVIFSSIASFGQNKQDQVNKIADEISTSLKKLGLVLTEEDNSQKSDETSISVNTSSSQNENIFYSYYEDKNGFVFKNEGLYISGDLNCRLGPIPSPILFGRIKSNEINSLAVGYGFNYKTKAKNDSWWGLSSLSRETSVYVKKFFTNEYQISLKGNYSWKYAKDYINIGVNFDGGFYSLSLDSTLKPYAYFGGNASLFYLYGSFGIINSPYIGYKSLYVFMNDFIPVFELGIKTPDFRIKDFYLGASATYVKYEFYNPRVYSYDINGQVIEDTSKRVDKDFFRASVSLSDFYGNVFAIGATTHDLNNFQIGASLNISLNNVRKYF